MKTYRMSLLSARSISLDTTFKAGNALRNFPKFSCNIPRTRPTDRIIHFNQDLYFSKSILNTIADVSKQIVNKLRGLVYCVKCKI
jgi:hypothetical protein